MTNAKPATILQLPLTAVVTDFLQPRKAFDEDALQDLASSIKLFGLIEPVIVRGPDKHGNYMLVAGERRFRACQILELPTIDAIARQDMDDEGNRFALQIVENLQRENLSTADMVAGVQALVKMPGEDGKPLGVTGAAHMLGRHKSWVSRRAKVADCAPAILQLVKDGKVTDVDLAADLQTMLNEFPDHATQIIENLQLGEYRNVDFYIPEVINRASVKGALESLRSEKQREEALEAQYEADPNYEKVNGQWRWRPQHDEPQQMTPGSAPQSPADPTAENKALEQARAALRPLRDQLEQSERSLRQKFGTNPDYGGSISTGQIVAAEYVQGKGEEASSQVPEWPQFQRRFHLHIEAKHMPAIIYWLAEQGLRPAWNTSELPLTGEQLDALNSWLDSGANEQVQLASGPIQQPAHTTEAGGSFEEQVSAFIESACKLDAKARTAIADIYDRWLDWCQANGQRASDKPELVAELKRDPKIQDCKFGHKGTRGLSGLVLL